MRILGIGVESYFIQSLLELIEIVDSFDQLANIAVMVDYLYPSSDPVYPIFLEAITKAAKHLQANPNIGLTEVQNA